jgi:predicted phosphodiesterase
MKIAIISDVHSNLPALNAVLEAIRADGVERIICGGDLVGYNAEPAEVVARIRELKIPCVLGNHDAAVAGITDPETFNAPAQAAVEWTAQQLDGGTLEYLRGLPYVTRIESFTMVHGTLHKPEQWGYIFNAYEAEEHFQHQRDTVCFIGHSHIPGVFIAGDMVTLSRSNRVRIQAGQRYVVNVGSVGQPRDNNPAASYAIYDMVENAIHFRRVPYDVQAAQQRILDAGLPNVLAMRLAIGK